MASAQSGLSTAEYLSLPPDADRGQAEPDDAPPGRRYNLRMPDPFRHQTIETWVSDFSDVPAFRELPLPAQEYASEVLPVFLGRACEERDVEPAEIEASDLKPALLDGVGSLTLPNSVRAVVPDLCAQFLASLEAQGRLAEGRRLGRHVRALRGAYAERADGVSKPITRPGSKLGRNDPCPCGSGLKYKKCCMNR